MLLEAKNIQKNYFQDKLKVEVLKNINFYSYTVIIYH